MPGRDFVAGRALAAMQTSQAAGTAGCGSLPRCPVAFLPSEVPLLRAKDHFATEDLPKEAVRAWIASPPGRSWALMEGDKEGRDLPEIVLCDVRLLLSK